MTMRRAFLGTLAGVLLAAPLATEAQSQRIVRVGYLGGSPLSPAQPTEMGLTPP
jgi:hypothetical protein